MKMATDTNCIQFIILIFREKVWEKDRDYKYFSLMGIAVCANFILSQIAEFIDICNARKPILYDEKNAYTFKVF